MNDKAKTPVVQYGFTPNIPGILLEHNLSILVSTYQAQRVLLMHPTAQNRMNMLMRTMPKPTGLAYRRDRLAICCKNQIWIFGRVSNLQHSDEFRNSDWIFSPRLSYVTGDLSLHQAMWLKDRLLFVNTRFSCIATVHPDYSFETVWQPNFISTLLPEDRCHLNGFCANEAGQLQYATALGKTDSAGGWRENKAAGGIVIDIPSGEIVSSGLSMPHTPFLYNGQLFVLESGKGALVHVDVASGKREEVTRFPGFVRGFSVFNNICVVGLSLIRNSSIFSDLPIGTLEHELQCAVYFYDLHKQQVLGFIQYTKGIEELFDIAILPDTISPHLVGFEEDTIDQVVVLQ